MRVSERADVRSLACDGAEGTHPGWVAEDLTGSERTDYGVLLVSAVPKRTEYFQGAAFTVRDFVLAIYVTQVDGSFKEFILHEREGAIPSIYMLLPYRETTAYDFGKVQCNGPECGRALVRLQHPGVYFISCGQFGVVYHWNGAQFSTITISD
jgi:hypothetical protein